MKEEVLFSSIPRKDEKATPSKLALLFLPVLVQ